MIAPIRRMKLGLWLLSGFAFCSATLPRQGDPLAESIARGKTVYTDYCISCHMAKGEGVPEAFPPLAQSDYLLKTPNKAIHAVKYGLQGPVKVNGKEYNNMMPEAGLSDEEVADVMNYILNSWGNSSNKKRVTVAMVQAVKRD
jgi:mono/diheme cytochrome c family protein